MNAIAKKCTATVQNGAGTASCNLDQFRFDNAIGQLYLIKYYTYCIINSTINCNRETQIMATRSSIEAAFKQAASSVSEIADDLDLWANRIAALLQVLEASHHQGVLDLAAAIKPHDAGLAAGLAERAQAGLAVCADDGFDFADTDNDLAFCLYWIHNLPPEFDEAINAHKFLKVLWPAFVTATPAPVISGADLTALRNVVQQNNLVLATSDGTVLGTHKYEQIDSGWLWTVVNRILNWLGVADFRARDDFSPIPLSPRPDTGTDGVVKIAIIGDWGTGTYPASPEGDGQQAADVLKTAASLNPDYIIHLGDTYYAGTAANRPPAGEENANMVNLWAQLTAGFPTGRFFTLNSNHEMYGGAYGIYTDALDTPMFAAQGGTTYFALEYKNWLIGAIDSAYYSPSITYLKGGLGDTGKDPHQYQFLQDFSAYADAGGMTTMLMSHHNPITTFADGLFGTLWDDVTGSGGITPDYWYWGHIHLAAVYSDTAPIWQQLNLTTPPKARCVGHSAIPVATPWGFSQPEHTGAATWWAATPKNPPTDNNNVIAQLAERIKNGFGMITLSDGGILEEIYDQDSTTPVWTSK